MRHFCQYPLLVFFSITIIANKKSASCWQWSNLQISLLQHCLRNADVCLGSSCRLARTLQPSDLNGESNRKGDVHKWHWHFLVSLTPLGGYVSPSSSFGLPFVPHCHLMSSFWVTIGCLILRRHLWMAKCRGKVLGRRWPQSLISIMSTSYIFMNSLFHGDLITWTWPQLKMLLFASDLPARVYSLQSTSIR